MFCIRINQDSNILHVNGDNEDLEKPYVGLHDKKSELQKNKDLLSCYFLCYTTATKKAEVGGWNVLFYAATRKQ